MLLQSQAKEIAKLTDGVGGLTHTLNRFIVNIEASFERVNDSVRHMDGRLTRIEDRLTRFDTSLCHIAGKVDNIEAKNRNGMLRRLEERLEVVKVFQWHKEQQAGRWVAPAKPPRFVRDFWRFGRCLTLRSADVYEYSGKI
jgi:hypothetical protein